MAAGVFGGYLGLGGGIIMVPFLSVVAGVDIKTAAAVSLAAIVVNSFTASNEFLKKGMVDLELVITLSLFGVMGNIVGSRLSPIVPAEYVRLALAVLVLYAAFSLLKTRAPIAQAGYADLRSKRMILCTALAFLTGILAGLIGVGGGVILVPLLYLVIGLPLDSARGTSSMIIGFSSAAATAVYFMSGQLDPVVAAPVICGIIPGAKLGGFFGTMAPPAVVKTLFFIIMLYLAFRMSYQPLMELL